MDYFPFHIWDGIIIPIDELIFFRGVGIPPTSGYNYSILQLYHHQWIYNYIYQLYNI